MFECKETTDKQDVLGILSESFEREFSMDFIEWLGACPTGSNRWFIARDGRKTIGVYGMLPRKAVLNGYPIRVALANNAGVIRSYRNKNVFIDLGFYATKKMGLPLYVGSSNLSAVKGHLKVGWSKVAALELLSGRWDTTDFFPHGFAAYDYREENFYFDRGFGKSYHNWRYQPCQVYKNTHARYYVCSDTTFGRVIWKMRNGRKQVVQHDGIRSLVLCCDSKTFDVSVIKGSRLSEILKDRGFKSIVEHYLVMKPQDDLKIDPYKIRFEPADNEVF